MAYLTRLLSGAALAAAVALAVSACAPASAPQRTVASTSAAAALTVADARQVFDSYVSASARYSARGNQAAALALTEGVQWDQVKADYLEAGKLPRYRYGSPVFYLPEQSGYPQWFVADVPRDTVNAAANAGTLAGISLPASGHVLMLFEKASAASPWLLASSAQLAPGESVPKLAAASGAANGHVATASTTDTSLLARPDVAGALQAAVVDDGPASAAARVVASGPLTTGLHAAQAALAPAQTPRGDVHFWALDGSNFTKFALRTADGGDLVFYTMYLNITTEVHAEYSNSSPVLPGPGITVPAEFTPFLTPGTPAPRVRLITQLTLAFAAVDPPPGSAKIQVIAIGGGPNYASASLADGAVGA